MIIIVASPSASGKSTLVSQAIQQFKLHRLITTTTRKIRPEENGTEYHFISLTEFNAIKSNDGFVECNEVYGNMYGLTKSEVNAHSHLTCIAILDVGGVKTMKSLYGDSVKTIFIMPPSMELIKSILANRQIGDNAENERRLASIDREMTDIDEFDYHIQPNDLKNSIIEFNTTISKIICPVFR